MNSELFSSRHPIMPMDNGLDQGASNKTKIKILIPSEQSETERMKATKVNEIQDTNQ
jgi:hypothetical protein